MMIRIEDQSKLDYYIKKHEIKAMFDPTLFDDKLRDQMELHLFTKGEFICQIDESLDYFYFIVTGKAKVLIPTQSGKSLLIQFYTPPKLIGIVEFLDMDTATSNVEVVEDTLCIGIRMAAFNQYVEDDKEFLKFACHRLGKLLVKSSKASSINLLYPVESRLASYLLASTPKDESASIVNEITADKATELADLLGTSYRHLVRTINKLTDEGIIRKEKKKFIILDRERLEEISADLYV